ncbi:MAG: hypothetical protein ACRD8Z_21360 [Nitrososphaeraceae archaeon]
MNEYGGCYPLLLGIIVILIMSLYLPVLAHNFSTNESAVFLALTDALKAEVQLVQQNLANNSISLASDHANIALALLTDDVSNEIAERNQRLSYDLNTDLASLMASTESASGNNTASDTDFLVDDINGIVDEIVSARIDPDQLNNSTTQALRMIELLDKLLISYGNAYAVGFDMTNMSMMMMGSSNDGMNSMLTTNMSMGNESGDNMSTGSISMNNNNSASDTSLVNITEYQTAQAIAMKINEVFNSQLAGASSAAPGQSIDNIASALQELMTRVDSKASPMNVMTIVHTKVHPNLLSAFNLNLR